MILIVLAAPLLLSPVWFGYTGAWLAGLVMAGFGLRRLYRRTVR